MNSAFPRKCSPFTEIVPTYMELLDKPVFGQYDFAAPVGAIVQPGDVVHVTDRAKIKGKAVLQ